MALSRDEIYEKVRGVLVDALGVDEDEIRGYFEAQGLLERFHEIKRTTAGH